MKIEHNVDECSLTVANIKEEDIGTYTLLVKNKLGKIDSVANVKVIAALKFNKQLTDLDILQGSNGNLSVVCEGLPKPKLTWYVEFPSFDCRLSTLQNLFTLEILRVTFL